MRKRKTGPRSKGDKGGMTQQMWDRLRAMTNDDVLAAARKDADARPLEDRDRTQLMPARHLSPAKRVRWQLRMSQSEFAKAFRIPLATLRDWEQHRHEPDQPALAYLQVIARDPVAVRRALEAHVTEAA
jgi:putative transcriptional regulator